MNNELALLLVFLVFGIIAGFIIKYFWKIGPNCKKNSRVLSWTKDCKPEKCVNPEALPENDCVRYTVCDKSKGPSYEGPSGDKDLDAIATYTKEECISPLFGVAPTKYENRQNKELCWDEELLRCYNV